MFFSEIDEDELFTLNELDEFSFFNHGLFSIMLSLNDNGRSIYEDYKLDFEKDMERKRIEFKSSINYSIITGKNYYNKRNKLKK